MGRLWFRVQDFGLSGFREDSSWDLGFGYIGFWLQLFKVSDFGKGLRVLG